MSLTWQSLKPTRLKDARSQLRWTTFADIARLPNAMSNAANAIELAVMAGHRLRTALDRALRPLGSPSAPFNYAQYRVLDYVARNEGRARAEIAHALGINQSALTKTIDSWVQSGVLTESSREPHGYRLRHFLTLSDAGVELLANARDAVLGTASKVESHMSEPRLNAMAELCSESLEAFPTPRYKPVTPYVRKRRA